MVFYEVTLSSRPRQHHTVFSPQRASEWQQVATVAVGVVCQVLSSNNALLEFHYGVTSPIRQVQTVKYLCP